MKKLYMGIVENNNDINRKGRIKVRVSTLYNEIPVEDLPYAYPLGSLSGKAFQIPAIGKLVNVLFLSDDIYSPYYIYSENYNINLENKITSLSNNHYKKFKALLFNHATQFFIQGEVLTIDQLLNKIIINNHSINLELKDNFSRINLGERNSSQSAVLGTNFFNWMDKFIREFMDLNSFKDTTGQSLMKPFLDQICGEYQKNKQNFRSDVVKLVDNFAFTNGRDSNTINNINDPTLNMPPGSYSDELLRQMANQNDENCYEMSSAAPITVQPTNSDDKNNLLLSQNVNKDKVNFLGVNTGNTSNNEISATTVSPSSVAKFGDINPCPEYKYLSSYYGYRKAPVDKNGNSGSTYHMGVDLAAAEGKPVLAVFKGKVTAINVDSGSVFIEHDNINLTTFYTHMDKVLVRTNEIVLAGQQIGKVGNKTGKKGASTENHLHFEVRNPLSKIGKGNCDPELFFKWEKVKNGTKKREFDATGKQRDASGTVDKNLVRNQTSAISNDPYNVNQPCPDISNFNNTNIEYNGPDNTSSINKKIHKICTNESSIAYNYFLSTGWSPTQAAGIVGNLIIESAHWDKKVISGKRKGDLNIDRKGAAGIGQWRLDRQDNLVRFLKNNYNVAMSESTLEQQLAFVTWELNHGYRHVYKKLKLSQTIDEAAEIWDRKYEVSNGKSINSRIKYAKQVYDCHNS